MKKSVLVLVVMSAIVGVAPTLAQQIGPGTASASGNAAPQDAPPKADAGSGALTWHGITLYGALDVGVGWVSHGLPENGVNYEGCELAQLLSFWQQSLSARR